MPYQVTGIDVEVAPGDLQTVTVDLQVRSSDGQPGRHVLRIDVSDPKRRPRPEYSANLEAPRGAAHYTLPICLNDPPGTWQMRVRDVASGVTTYAEVPVAKE